MNEGAVLDLLARELGAVVVSENADNGNACLICGGPADWTSPTGHHFCSDCRLQDLRSRRIWTAAELMAVQFPPLRFAIPGLVPEGLVLLGGKPKSGSPGSRWAGRWPSLASLSPRTGHSSMRMGRSGSKSG